MKQFVVVIVVFFFFTYFCFSFSNGNLIWAWLPHLKEEFEKNLSFKEHFYFVQKNLSNLVYMYLVKSNNVKYICKRLILCKFSYLTCVVT